MKTSLNRLVTEPEQPRPISHLVTLSSPPARFWAPVVIRLATAGDRPSLERLAQLDSTSVPVGETAIGELDGRPVVAVSLRDGQEIADPFVATAELLQLVRLRAQQLSRVSHASRPEPGSAGGKAPAARTKGGGASIGSFLPMRRRASQLILPSR